MKKTLTLLALALNLCLYAQPGSLDLTFNPGTGANDRVTATAIQSDGKIIISGLFTSYNGTAQNRIARLNTNGTLDATFNPGTGIDVGAKSITIQSDGKIIIGGLFSTYNGTSRNGIARLNTNGSLDATFNPGTGVSSPGSGVIGSVFATSLQSDGKIIIGGFFSDYNGTTVGNIARLNTNGTLDATFNTGTGADDAVNTTVLQSNGKIIICGEFIDYNGTTQNNIARLNTNGTLDATFDPGMGVDNSIYATALQSDGKIIIGGAFVDYNGTTRNSIARLNTNGSIDATFDPGTGATNAVFGIAIQNDGKIIIVGGFISYNGTSRVGVARLNTDGSLDAVFNPGTGVNNPVFATNLQSDGKVIIGGAFASYNGTARNSIARLNNTSTSGVASLEENFNLQLYPNPTANNTTLVFDATENNLLEIAVSNSLGEKVMVPITKKVGMGKQQIEIPTTTLSDGIYFVQLKSSGTSATKPLVVQH